MRGQRGQKAERKRRRERQGKKGRDKQIGTARSGKRNRDADSVKETERAVTAKNRLFDLPSILYIFCVLAFQSFPHLWHSVFLSLSPKASIEMKGKVPANNTNAEKRSRTKKAKGTSHDEGKARRRKAP